MKTLKNCFLLILLLTICNLSQGQELSLNESTSFNEYSQIKESDDKKLIAKLKNRLTELNYKDISIQDASISGQGFTSHLVGGFATVEIKYMVKIAFKDGRYKLTLTNFILTDNNGSNPLEGMRSFEKKWIKIINGKLPEIIKNIENINSGDDW
jgi:hypothetical protein